MSGLRMSIAVEQSKIVRWSESPRNQSGKRWDKFYGTNHLIICILSIYRLLMRLISSIGNNVNKRATEFLIPMVTCETEKGLHDNRPINDD